MTWRTVEAGGGGRQGTATLEGTDLTPAQAIAAQKQWAGLVREKPIGGPIQRVAGADVAFSRDGQRCVAAVVLLTYPGLAVSEMVQAEVEVAFPYIPGLLSFREAPAVVAAAGKLTTAPDVLLVDGQGVAHPRRFGLASHVGVQLGWRTIGCAKSRLIGEFRAVGGRRGCCCRLTDGGEVIGKVVRSRDGVKCLYVSVGHRVELDEAVRVVLGCCRGYRIPEPIRQAHQMVTRLRVTVGMDKGT